MRRALILLVCLVAFGCQKPTLEECEELCWRYSELMFWEAFDKSIEGKSEAEVAELRAAKQAEWDELRSREENHARDNCRISCRQGADKSTVSCVKKAETAEQARACIED